MSTPVKRALTDKTRSAVLATNSLLNDGTGVDVDLTARLRNMASRVRKNVTEGYSASAPVSPNVSPTKPRLLFTGSLPFRSANDTLRDVYSGRLDRAEPWPSSSSKKRKLAMLEEMEEGPVLSDDEIDMCSESSSTTLTSRVPSFHDPQMRPMKSLRPVRREGTRSMPAGTFQFLHNSGGPDVCPMKEHTMEDDWSAGAFPQTSAKVLT